MHLSKKDLVLGFRNLGIRNGDLLMVHSSLSSLGYVDGGARTVCEALIDVCGPEGMLVMPTLFGKSPWHVKESKSGVGIITETFRLMAGVVRSVHPTHSVAALGPKAKALTADHEKAPTACGKKTPFGRLTDWGGKILMIGCDLDRLTLLHTIEDYADAPYLSTRTAKYVDDTGEVMTIEMKRFPGPHRNFIGAGPLLVKSGAMRIGKVGKAVCRIIDASKMAEVLLGAIKDDPALFLCDNPNCNDCVLQRGKIKEARIRTQEDFVLSASSEVLGRSIPEIVLACQAEGIRAIEVSVVDGTDVTELNGNAAAGLLEALGKADIKAASVRSARNSPDLNALVAAARRLGTDTVVAPLSQDVVKQVMSMDPGDTRFLLENTTQKTDEIVSMLEELPEDSVGLALNPANLARQGVHPFLGAYYKKHGKLRVGQISVCDATYSGEATLPGMGNGEVKEIISAARCRSFGGFVCLSGPLAEDTTFKDHAAAFWRLLDTM